MHAHEYASNISCWCCITMALHVLYFVPSEVIISILNILLFLIVIWYLLFLMSGLPSLKCLFLCRLSVLSVWQLLWFFLWVSAVEISIVYFYSNICICPTSYFQSLWSQNSKNVLISSNFFFCAVWSLSYNSSMLKRLRTPHSSASWTVLL